MTGRRRAPRISEVILGDANRSMRNGGSGLVYNSAPVAAVSKAAAMSLAGLGSSQVTLFYRDRFALTGSTPTLSLTYLPIGYSPHVYLNGLEQDEGTDYTIADRAVTVLAAMGALSGDVIDVRYAYLSGMPAAAADGVATAYTAAVMADSPIAYYRMDDSGTTVSDFTGHGHDGSMVGTDYSRLAASMLPTDPNASTAFTYGASTTYVSVPTASAFNTSAFTLEMWSDRGATSSSICYSHDQRVQVVFVAGYGRLNIWSGGAWVQVAQTYSGSWTDTGHHHLVVTYDGSSRVRFYKDGTQYGTDIACTTALPSASTAVLFGPTNGINTVETDHYDEVAIYGVELTAARISAHFAAA